MIVVLINQEFHSALLITIFATASLIYFLGVIAAIQTLRLRRSWLYVLVIVTAFQVPRLSIDGWQYLFQSGMGAFISISNTYPEFDFSSGIGSKVRIDVGGGPSKQLIGVNIIATGMIGVLVQWYHEIGNRIMR